MAPEISHCSHRPLLRPCTLERFTHQLDPYIGCEHYCYYCYALDRAETDWRKEIRIYPDIAAQLSEEIKDLPPQTIYMGTHTDPYQPCEAVCKQTRKVLEVLLDAGFSAGILTKSDLAVRDLDIIEKMRDGALSVSVAFSDPHTHALFEANTQETARRVAVLKTYKKAGVRTGALICPVIPYITDVIPILEMLTPHADTIWVYGLSMPEGEGQNLGYIREILHRHYPGLVNKIQRCLASKQDSYWAELSGQIRQFRDERDLDIRIHV